MTLKRSEALVEVAVRLRVARSILSEAVDIADRAGLATVADLLTRLADNIQDISHGMRRTK